MPLTHVRTAAFALKAPACELAHAIATAPASKVGVSGWHNCWQSQLADELPAYVPTLRPAFLSCRAASSATRRCSAARSSSMVVSPVSTRPIWPSGMLSSTSSSRHSPAIVSCSMHRDTNCIITAANHACAHMHGPPSSLQPARRRLVPMKGLFPSSVAVPRIKAVHMCADAGTGTRPHAWATCCHLAPCNAVCS